jgi:hypothetical protein
MIKGAWRFNGITAVVLAVLCVVGIGSAQAAELSENTKETFVALAGRIDKQEAASEKVRQFARDVSVPLCANEVFAADVKAQNDKQVSLDEIKKVDEEWMNAEAARDTSGLIEESRKNADHGVEVSDTVGKVLEQIAANVDKIGTLITEVSTASSEQARGVDQIRQAVLAMDDTVQSNAANAEESASSSEELSAQSNEVPQQVVNLLGLIGEKATTT